MKKEKMQTREFLFEHKTSWQFVMKNSDSEKEKGDHRSVADHKKGARKLE